MECLFEKISLDNEVWAISIIKPVASTGSEILVKTGDIVPETRASRSLLLDLFVLRLAKERDK